MIDEVMRAVPRDRMLRWVDEVSRLDRYQASLGLERAAELVAAAAAEAGLTDVTIRRYPADGRTHWWTFEAPRSWTPVTARLTVLHDGAPVVALDHRAEPFAVATYSAPTPGEVVAPVVMTGGPVRGALVLLDAAASASGTAARELAAAGALGFVTDAPAKGDDGVHRGRIELPPLGTLLAFSLTGTELRRVVAALDRSPDGVTARVTVECDRTADMPVVSGVLPGDRDEDEVWLTAHLCHPRPSANDNASGVAALLGVASGLSALRRSGGWATRRPIRFLWGPEFVGTAASLHDRIGPGQAGRPPHALINLDMVGEDQEACRSPFVVERPPDYLHSPLGPLAEHVTGRVFAATADRPGDWSVSPFLGFSDHALVADPVVARPAVQLCHPADRFNHSAGDRPDRVSEVEMLRSATIGAVLAQLVAGDGPPPQQWQAVADEWAAREFAAADRVARSVGGRWGEQLRAYTAATVARMRHTLRTGEPVADERPALDGGLRRHWDGPLNLRAMTAALPPDARADLDALVAADKRRLSELYHCAVRADGSRDDAQLVAEASLELRRPIPAEAGERLIGALRASAWLSAATDRAGH